MIVTPPLGQADGVVHGLPEGPLHVLVVGPGAAQGGGSGFGLGAALLGLQDEAAGLEEIDGPGAGAAVQVGDLQILLEAVGRSGILGFGRGQVQGLAQVEQERVLVGTLVPGRSFPLRKEGGDGGAHGDQLSVWKPGIGGRPAPRLGFVTPVARL